MQFLKDSNQDLSMKRLFGLACLVSAIVLAFVKGDSTLCGIFLGSASAVFVVQAITKT